MFARTLKIGLTVTALIVGTGLACAFDAPPSKTPPKAPTAPKAPAPPAATPDAPAPPSAKPVVTEKTPMVAIPDAVKDAAEKYFGSTHFVIHNVLNDGVTWYAANGSKDGDQVAIRITDNGHVAESRASLDNDQLPAAVRDGITKMYPTAKFKEIEKVTKHFYHVEITVDGKKQDLKIFANGQPVHNNDDERHNH